MVRTSITRLALGLWFGLVMLVPSTGASAAPQVRYDVAGGVSAADEATARAGVELARTYIAGTFGAPLEQDLDVAVRDAEDSRSPYIVAYAGGDELVVYTGSIGWQTLSPALRTQVIVHEYVHIFQRDELGYTGDVSPMWLIEGMAEVVSFDAVEAIGIVDPRAVVDEQARQVVAGSGVLPRLAALEDIDDYQSADGPIYPLSFLAVRRLIGDPAEGRLQRYLDLVDGGMPWRRAFPRAFGTDLDDFYDAFERWLDEDLVAPRRQPAAFRYPAPERREADVAIESAPESVRPGEQFVVVAETQPDAVCRFDLASGDGERLATIRTQSDPSGRVFWLQALPDDQTDGVVTVTANCGGKRDRIEVAVEG